MADKSGFQSFMGWVAAGLSAPVAIAGGLIVATAKSIEEGSTDSFGTSFSDAAEKVLTGAQQIGEEYGPQLVVGVTTIVVGGAIRGDLDKNG